MLSESHSDVTQLLIEWSKGDQAARDKLMAVIYDELHKLASSHLQRRYSGNSLQTTALVHEVYLRLVKYKNIEWQDRAQFFALSAQIMRGILVDHFRSNLTDKRGRGGIHISLDEAVILSEEWGENCLALNDALTRLEALSPKQSKIVELRFFGGLTVEETAEVLKVSTKTIKREWSVARAWLYKELSN